MKYSDHLTDEDFQEELDKYKVVVWYCKAGDYHGSKDKG